jgi:hypothetical protein
MYQLDMSILRATMAQYEISIMDEGPGGLSILEVDRPFCVKYVNPLNIIVALIQRLRLCVAEVASVYASRERGK